MATSAAQIEALCDAWCAASKTPEGGMAIGGATERHRLLANGVVFYELDFDGLCAAITGTSRVLLRPGLNTVVSQDHFALWSWCAELLLSPRAGFFSRDQFEITALFETTVHAALASCRRPTQSREEWEAENKRFELLPHHAKYFVEKSHLSLAYLGFPLLEAMTKRACSAYLDLSGNVVSKFSIPRKKGGTRSYNIGDQVSSLRDLLHLHYSLVAKPELSNRISKLRSHVSELDSSQDPFDIVYAWRNESLHGSANFQTIGGTLLNWSLLISLSELEASFEKHREVVLKHCQWELQSSFRSSWSFYPPY
ncbi:MAG: hypothetical protein ACOY4W_05900 [Thermodesulfobacteriota bacterium]